MEKNDREVDEHAHPILIAPISVSSQDVLCGKGKDSFNHEGNLRFREIVTSYVESYLACKTASERATVIESLLDNIQSNGGRFLRKHQITGKWLVMSSQHRREKVVNAIRDACKKKGPSSCNTNKHPCTSRHEAVGKVEDNNEAMTLKSTLVQNKKPDGAASNPTFLTAAGFPADSQQDRSSADNKQMLEPLATTVQQRQEWIQNIESYEAISSQDLATYGYGSLPSAEPIYKVQKRNKLVFPDSVSPYSPTQNHEASNVEFQASSSTRGSTIDTLRSGSIQQTQNLESLDIQQLYDSTTTDILQLDGIYQQARSDSVSIPSARYVLPLVPAPRRPLLENDKFLTDIEEVLGPLRTTIPTTETMIDLDTDIKKQSNKTRKEGEP